MASSADTEEELLAVAGVCSLEGTAFIDLVHEAVLALDEMEGKNVWLESGIARDERDAQNMRARGGRRENRLELLR